MNTVETMESIKKEPREALAGTVCALLPAFVKYHVSVSQEHKVETHTCSGGVTVGYRRAEEALLI